MPISLWLSNTVGEQFVLRQHRDAGSKNWWWQEQQVFPDTWAGIDEHDQYGEPPGAPRSAGVACLAEFRLSARQKSSQLPQETPCLNPGLFALSQQAYAIINHLLLSRNAWFHEGPCNALFGSKMTEPWLMQLRTRMQLHRFRQTGCQGSCDILLLGFAACCWLLHTIVAASRQGLELWQMLSQLLIACTSRCVWCFGALALEACNHQVMESEQEGSLLAQGC